MEEEKVVGGRVKIDGRYYIRLEASNLILCEAKVVKSGDNAGKEVESVVGYYTSLEGVFNRYFKEQVVNRSVGLNMELREFKKLLEEIKNDIKAIRKEFEV